MTESLDVTNESFDVTKCLRCDKDLQKNVKSIGCDECAGRLHLKCAGIKVKEFEKICNDPHSTFICRYCKYYKCGKCSKPVYPRHINAIQCDINSCQKWYHLRCSPFTQAEFLNKKSRLHTDPWYCPCCTSFPFSNLCRGVLK